MLMDTLAEVETTQSLFCFGAVALIVKHSIALTSAAAK